MPAPELSSSQPAPATSSCRVLQVLLLDPHEEDRSWFRHLLLRHPSLRLAAEATDFRTALQQIEKTAIDLVVLDPGVVSANTSLEAALALIPPEVRLLFTTAETSLAVQAFELDAVDFLIKPIAAARLNETVRRLLRIEWARPAAPTPPGDGPVLVPFERGRRGISLHTISLIQAFGNYTRVVQTDGKSEIVLRSLTKWQDLLPSPPFCRVHRSALVHEKNILRLETNDGGAFLHLQGVEESVPVSRRLLPGVRQFLFSREESPQDATVRPTSDHR